MEFNDDSYTQFTQMYGNLYLWEHIGKCCGIFLSSTENKFGTRQKTLKQTADVGLKTLEETEFQLGCQGHPQMGWPTGPECFQPTAGI